MPTVSVIIPTYKHLDFVLATLDSVFAQTYTDYEVIVVNDGSPDHTADVLRPLADTGCIRYIEQENQGQAAARNRGLAEATGEFIAFLDDDDKWPKNKLETQIRLMETHPEAVLVYGHAETVGMDTIESWVGANAPSGNVIKAFLKQNWITSPGQVLIRSKALTEIRGFDINLWGVDDWDLYIRLAKIGTFQYDTSVALYYRIHTANASKNVSRMYENACLLVHKHRASYNKRELFEVKRYVDTFYANQYIQVALSAKKQGHWKAVREMLWMAVHLQPNIVKERCFVAALTASLLPGSYAFLQRSFHHGKY